MKMTTKPPRCGGYYWWTNLGEHTPTILLVRQHGPDSFYARNDEFEFCIDDEPTVFTKADYDGDEAIITVDGVDYFYGTHFWAGPIPLPTINNEEQQIDSF